MRNLLFRTQLLRAADETVIRDGRKRAPQAKLLRVISVRTGAHSDHEIAQAQSVRQGACRADADDRIDAVEVIQFIRIDPHGRHPHAGRHHRHALPAVRARIALNAADVADQLRMFQIVFRNKTRTHRIARHQHRVRDRFPLRADMQRSMIHLSSSSKAI